MIIAYIYGYVRVAPTSHTKALAHLSSPWEAARFSPSFARLPRRRIDTQNYMRLNNWSSSYIQLREPAAALILVVEDVLLFSLKIADPPFLCSVREEEEHPGASESSLDDLE